LNSSKRILASVGTERDTKDKQIQYLLDLATQYQRIATLGVQADYGGDKIFDSNQSLCLATELICRSEDFAEDMARVGHCFPFHQDGDVDLSSIDEEPNSNTKKPIQTRRVLNSVELNELLSGGEVISVQPSRSILDWLKELYQRSRGFELGTFEPSILTAAMRQQSGNWNMLSTGFACDAVAMVYSFIKTLLHSLCAEEQVCDRLLNVLMDGLIERYSQSLEQVKFLLKVELNGVPVTVNHYFNDNLQKQKVVITVSLKSSPEYIAIVVNSVSRMI
jgi:hypothetical protein